ncbi:hypothetical protein BHM03_00041070 [Ensete ventricosum]|nr:hypothetical protein BHM03_00041070 [Ensete ventricosum]
MGGTIVGADGTTVKNYPGNRAMTVLPPTWAILLSPTDAATDELVACRDGRLPAANPLQGRSPTGTVAYSNVHMELVPAGTTPARKSDRLLARWTCKVALHANTTAADGAQHRRMHRGDNGGSL